MATTTTYDLVLLGLGATAVVVFVALLFVTAPYGRHSRRGWGPTLPARLGWVLMESPAVLAFAGFYAIGPHALELVPLVLLAAWQAHYVQRTFVYPFRIRPSRRTPAAVVAMAFGFNVANAYLNASWLSRYGAYGIDWLTDPRFVLGMALFATGYAINRWADDRLRRLRPAGSREYRIPRGGLYRWISCPNYFGEMVEWFGWALATWSPAGLCFALFTTANLLPRALSHHRWYRAQFADYPSERRAVLPFVL